MAFYSSSSKASTSFSPVTEFDILKASHKFLRDDEAEDGGNSSWNDQLARKYYDSLYREFAVCDLKHYKSGNLALRWRTENEVLSGAGETTCGNTRCIDHTAEGIPLSTLELPFAYEERGAQKSALVKIALCSKCVRKLMWKRNKEKEQMRNAGVKVETDESKRNRGDHRERKVKEREGKPHSRAEGERSPHRHERNERRPRKRSRPKDEHKSPSVRSEQVQSRRRSSRSRSPRPSDGRGVYC